VDHTIEPKIENPSSKKEVVFGPFGGSGPTSGVLRDAAQCRQAQGIPSHSSGLPTHGPW
jgi:hypothetical protein